MNTRHATSSHEAAKIVTVSDMDDHVGPAELAVMFGVSRQRISQITSRPDFPAPAATLIMGKVWHTDDVRAWAEKRGREVNE